MTPNPNPSPYLGAIEKGAAFIMDYGVADAEKLVRIADVQPADDVCCKVRLEGVTFWTPEFEFRRRATPVAAPSPHTLPAPGEVELREALSAMTAWKNRLAEAFERAEQRASELLAWKAEASAALAAISNPPASSYGGNGLTEAPVSIIARTVRQTLRDYGHSAAESSLPGWIANDVARALATVAAANGEAERADLIEAFTEFADKIDRFGFVNALDGHATRLRAAIRLLSQGGGK